jgi:hypothetical protein
MKIKEFIIEGPEEPVPELTSNLLPVLMFLKKRSEDKELAPKLRTDSLIQLVKNAGDTTFDYQTLVSAYESNEAVKELIKNFNKDSVTLKSAEDEDSGEEYKGQAKDPIDTVKMMAQKARKNRE